MELIVPPGWRLWHFGQKTDDTYTAQLYNENATRHGQGGDAFSSYGVAPTPQGAIDACLKGPTSEKLFHDNLINEEGLPLKAAKAAIEARQAMTRALRG